MGNWPWRGWRLLGRPQLAVIFPDGHWQGGAGDPRGHQSSLESHALATSSCLGHSFGVALSLAKHLLTARWWNIKVCGKDDCPPALTVLNIGQFMTNEEMAGGMGEPYWFMAYSVHCSGWVRWPTGGNGSGPRGRLWRSEPTRWCMPFGAKWEQT